MAAKKKTVTDRIKARNTRSVRDAAEKEFARSPERSLDLHGQTSEVLIHELRVHQIELETQAEELRRAQLALEESRDKFLDLYEFAPTGYFTLTGKALVTEANLTGAMLLGVERNRLLGARFSTCIAEKDADEWHRYFTNVLNRGEKQNCTLMLTRGDGSVFPARLESVRIPDSSKGTPIVRVAVSDITDIREAEDALRKSEEQFRLINNSSRDFIYSYDRAGRFTSANRSLCETMSLRADQIIGRTHAELMFPEAQCREWDELHKRVYETGAPVNALTSTQMPDGSIHVFEVILNPLHNSAGTITGIAGTTRDITDRKRAEEGLRLANRKLHLLTSITRHDISNQLTALQGYYALLEKKQPDPSLAGYFRKINATTDRISAMIRFTKEYEQIGVHVPAWQDLRRLVDTAAKEAPHGQVRVNNDLPAGTEVFADPLVVRVFYNLMDNAVRYGGKISTIRFSVEEHGGDEIIVCEDDGDGVAADEKEKIFARGFGKNTGLGLFLAREILTISGITIRETGVPGTGARFEMAVPKGIWRSAGPGWKGEN